MKKELFFGVPRGMTPESVAQTFTAYLIGSQSFQNADGHQGPFKTSGSHDVWQLDGSNDFWLHALGENQVMLRCRYDREVPIIVAAVALFRALRY